MSYALLPGSKRLDSKLTLVVKSVNFESYGDLGAIFIIAAFAMIAASALSLSYFVTYGLAHNMWESSHTPCVLV